MTIEEAKRLLRVLLDQSSDLDFDVLADDLNKAFPEYDWVVLTDEILAEEK